MRTRTVQLWIIYLLIGLFTAGTAIESMAQAPQAPSPAPEDEYTGDELMRQRRHIEQFRMLKLLETLQLQEGQEEEFIARFYARRRDQRALHHAREQLFDQLHDGLRADTLRDEQIVTLVDDIQQIRDQEYESQRAFLADIRTVLTPEQYGKLVVFQERFEYELLRTIDRFRRGPAPRDLPVGGKGQGPGRNRGGQDR